MLVRRLRVMWLMMWTLYALCKLAYSTAVATADKTYAVENRVDAIMPVLGTHAANIAATTAVANSASSAVGGVISGSTYVPNASYASNTTHVNGVSINQQSHPSGPGNYTANVGSYTLAQLDTFWTTTGDGGTYLNNLSNYVDAINNALQSAGIFS